MVIVLLFLFLLEISICCLLFNWNSIYYYVIFSTAFVYSMAANSLNNQQNKSPNSHCRIQSHCTLLAELKRRLMNAPFSLMTMRNGLILASVLSTSTILTYWRQLECPWGRRLLSQYETRPHRQQLELSWRPGHSPPVALDEHCLLLLPLKAVSSAAGLIFFQLEKERNWFKQLWRNQPST